MISTADFQEGLLEEKVWPTRSSFNQGLIAVPTVSVCIANYNGLGVVGDCIASVLAQDCEFPVEIIVHDDASTDDSARHIRTTFSEVVLIESTENVGFCVANNRMVQRASGDFVLLLNNDAALYPDALATLYKGMQDVGQPSILSLPQYDARTGDLLDIGCLLDFFLNPVPNFDQNRNEVAMVIGACLWIPKTLWKELGGFPEWFGSIGEDLYLCCRARLAGHPILALSNSGYRHWQGQSFGGGRVKDNRLSTTYRRRALSERNKSFVMALTYPSPVVQCLFPLHLVLLLVEGLMLSLIKREWNLFTNIYLAVLKDLWRGRGRLHRMRRMIQVARRRNITSFFSVFVFYPHKLRLLLKHGVPEIQ